MRVLRGVILWAEGFLQPDVGQRPTAEQFCRQLLIVLDRPGDQASLVITLEVIHCVIKHSPVALQLLNFVDLHTLDRCFATSDIVIDL